MSYGLHHGKNVEMRSPVRTLVFTALFACSTALAGQAWCESASDVLANQPPELLERLEKNRVVVLEDVSKDRDRANFTIAYVLFDKPAVEVMELVRQSWRQAEFRPELKSVEVIQKGELRRIDEHRIKILFSTIVYRLVYQQDPLTGRIEWSLDPDFDNGLSRLDGFWEIWELGDGRTLGRFGSVVDVGPFVPAFIQETMARRTVVQAITNCRRWVDSGGTWRP